MKHTKKIWILSFLVVFFLFLSNDVSAYNEDVCSSVKNECLKWEFHDVPDINNFHTWQCIYNYKNYYYNISYDITYQCYKQKKVNWACSVSPNKCYKWEYYDISDTNTQIKWWCKWKYWWKDKVCSLSKYKPLLWKWYCVETKHSDWEWWCDWPWIFSWVATNWPKFCKSWDIVNKKYSSHKDSDYGSALIYFECR